MKLKPLEKRVLLGLAILALIGPNGVFLYYLFFRRNEYAAAARNPVARVFMLDAFLATGLMAYYIGKTSRQKTEWLRFVLLSLVGSLGFSLPLFFLRQASIQEQALDANFAFFARS